MSDLLWLSDRQMAVIALFFPLAHGVPRVDDRRVLSGIMFVIRNGLRWREASLWPAQDALRSVCASEPAVGVFDCIFVALAGQAGEPDAIMIDSTHLKARRTAASMLKKGMFPVVSGGPKAA